MFSSKIKKIEKTGNYEFFSNPFNENWKLRYLILILPFFLEFLAFYTFCNYPVFSIENFVICSFYSTVIYAKLDHLINNNSPSYFGHVVAAVMFHWAVFIVHFSPCLFSFIFFSLDSFLKNLVYISLCDRFGQFIHH